MATPSSPLGQFPSEEGIWFFKLSTLILNTGGFIAKYALKGKVKAEQLTFPDFLNKKKHEVFHLFVKKLCCLCQLHEDNRQYGKAQCKFQWDILYVKHQSRKCRDKRENCCCLYDAKPSVNEDDLDISLIICLLVNLFQLSSQEMQAFKKLRDHRNTYFAHSTKASINESEFLDKFGDVAFVLKSITHPYGTPLHNQICKEIEEIKDDPMHILGYRMIMKWIQQMAGPHAHVIQEDFENAITKVMDFVKKYQREKTEERKMKGYSNHQDSEEIYALQEKVEKKLSEIKFHSVHGECQKKKTRPALSRVDSYTLPPKWKDEFIKRAISDEEPEYVDSIGFLKPHEKAFLLTIMKACRTGSQEEFENEMIKIPNRSQLLRVKDERGYCVIHYASERTHGAIPILQVLINHGANLGDQTSEGMTVLHIACKNGNVELCQFCLSDDPGMLNIEDFNGWNAALFASFYGNKAVISFLRKNSGELCIKSGKTSVNILHLACLSGNSGLYTELQKTYPEITREKDHDGRTVVHYAARGGNEQIMRMLIASKWVLQKLKKSKYPRNILHIACRYSDKNVVRLIISEYPFMLHESDKEGFSAVHYAAFGGNVSVMRLLIEFLNDKIEQYSINSKNNMNILQIACVHRKTEMWKFIAEKLSFLLLKRDDNGWFIQHVAARCGNIDILKIIVEENCVENITSKDVDGRTILHIASLYGKFEVCEYLVFKFPDMVKERDIFGYPACVLAARGGNSNAFQLLLKRSNFFLNNKDKRNMSDAAKLSNDDTIIKLTRDDDQEASLIEMSSYQTAVEVEEISVSLEMEAIQPTNNRKSTSSGD